jgi:hypothetical protein
MPIRSATHPLRASHRSFHGGVKVVANQVCCRDAGDPSIGPSTRCGPCGSVRLVRIGLDSDLGLCGPGDAMRKGLHALKVATRVRIPLGVPVEDALVTGPGSVSGLGTSLATCPAS